MSDKTPVTKTGSSVSKTDAPDKSRQTALRPPVDVIEDASGITLLADLPGVSKDKLNLQLATDSLMIEGEVDLAMPEGMESRHAEVHMPRYRRTFTLSRELDAEKATAELRNGVLKLRIPKAEHAQPRKIEVRAA
jgi:HSP20 family protein